MSVYTTINHSQLLTLLSDYPLIQSGQLLEFNAISNGIENTNYHLLTQQGGYILTIYEQFKADQLSWYLQLLQSLKNRGLPVPQVVADKNQQLFCHWQEKPAALFEQIDGQHIEHTSVEHCRQIGTFLGQFHSYSRHYTEIKANPWDYQGILSKAVQLKAWSALSTEDEKLLNLELGWQRQFSAAELPQGIIHADLFRDNALFHKQILSGVLDFYSACTGALLFDLAVVVNDWCTEPDYRLNQDKARSLIHCYQKYRPLVDSEYQQWPAMLRFAVLRFWVSRLIHQWQQNLKQNHANGPKQNSPDLVQDKDPDVLKYLLKNHRDNPLLHQLLE